VIRLNLSHGGTWLEEDRAIPAGMLTVTDNITSGDPGFVDAAGAHVDFTLTDSNGASNTLDAALSTCDDAGANTDGSGQCTIVFTSTRRGRSMATPVRRLRGWAQPVPRDGRRAPTRTTRSRPCRRLHHHRRGRHQPHLDAHDFTCHIEADDGSGGFASVDGATCTGTIDSDTANSSFVGGNTCITDSNGDCTLTINSNQPGVTVVSASTNVTVGGVALSAQRTE
jgi:hypothetical protein